MKVRELVKDAEYGVITISQEETVAKAISVMYDKRVGALIVTDDSNKPVGIMTERDVLKLLATMSYDETFLVKRFMTEGLYIVEPSDDVEYAVHVMVSKRIRHLPVAENGKIIAVFSMRDVVGSHMKTTEPDIKKF